MWLACLIGVRNQNERESRLNDEDHVFVDHILASQEAFSSSVSTEAVATMVGVYFGSRRCLVGRCRGVSTYRSI
jgi:hypothetical protein